MGPTALKSVLVYLRNRNGESDSLWLSQQGKPLQREGVQGILERLLRYAEVKAPGKLCHAFRHTFAVNFLEAGGDSLELQELLGHTSLTMVNRYCQQGRAERANRRLRELSPVERMLKG